VVKLAMTGRPAFFERLRRRFSATPWAATAEAAARLGYVARGSVYISIGLIALLAVAGLTPRAEGALGALEAWGRWPPGLALLWLTGLGLYGFAGWRALQSVFDADRQGRTPKAWASRAGQAISGVVYGSLAVSVFGLIDTIEDLHQADDQEKTRAFVEQALSWPLGEALVLGFGLFILAAGLGSVVRAFVDHFGRDLKCDARTAAWAGALARLGYFGRGLAMLPAGAFMLAAGWHARASEARSLGGALQALLEQPFGEAVLAFVSAGLMAFGAFAFVEAWYRPIRPDAGLAAGRSKSFTG
jgi:hypothetical protein